ncbi:MAG: hypothetical protein ABW175_19775, partial [Bradyrhizobium sp.]
LVVLAMTGVALAFGLISPAAMSEALEPVPSIAGAAGAVVMFVQMIGAASASWLVAWLFDGRSALSMAVTMAAFSLLAIAAFLATAFLSSRRSRAMSRLDGTTPTEAEPQAGASR